VTIYGLTSGTFIVAGVVIVTLLAVIYGTFSYRGGGITVTPAIRPAARPVRLTRVIPPAKGERQMAGPLQLTPPNSQPRRPAHTFSPPSTQGEAHGRSSPLRQ
jgi:hypothetical protein